MDRKRIADLELFDTDAKNPEELILRRIRELVRSGELKPGTRLPSERALAEQMKTSRGQVRKALQRLEFYGLVEISPQSGTRIASMAHETIEELIDTIPGSRDQKMADLMEARFIIDVQCARLAAERRSDEDMKLIDDRQETFLKAFYGNDGSGYLEEDYLFHLAIASASKNHVLVSMLSQLTPRIVTRDQPHLVQRDEDFSRIPAEHRAIIDAIRSRDVEGAVLAMTSHRNWAMKRVFEAHGPTVQDHRGSGGAFTAEEE
jgi:GntR family transcriptional repressor for pyruvate dehydrogenase complex